jgi:hypothetical protein
MYLSLGALKISPVLQKLKRPIERCRVEFRHVLQQVPNRLLAAQIGSPSRTQSIGAHVVASSSRRQDLAENWGHPLLPDLGRTHGSAVGGLRVKLGSSTP